MKKFQKGIDKNDSLCYNVITIKKTTGGNHNG